MMVAVVKYTGAESKMSTYSGCVLGHAKLVG